MPQDPSAIQPGPAGARPRILVAEDDAVTRRILESLLPQWGLEVISAVNGREAWEAWSKDASILFAVLDWMMPEMDGLSLCRKIRETEKSQGMTYIIILTARGQQEDIVQGLNAGANDFITKPFDKEEFRSRIGIGRRMVELQSALADRVQELERALHEIKTLQGLLPICMHCHKIRDEQKMWTGLVQYVSRHSEAKFSHSICPECMKKHHPEK